MKDQTKWKKSRQNILISLCYLTMQCNLGNKTIQINRTYPSGRKDHPFWNVSGVVGTKKKMEYPA